MSDNDIVTTSIRRMGEGTAFSLFASPHPEGGAYPRWGAPTLDGGVPTLDGGGEYLPWDRAAYRVLAMWLAVCLLRSRRRTFLLQI